MKGGKPMNRKLYALEVVREIMKNDNPNSLLLFMKEMAKISHLRQYSKGKDKENIPSVITKKDKEEYDKLKKRLKEEVSKTVTKEDNFSKNCREMSDAELYKLYGDYPY